MTPDQFQAAQAQLTQVDTELAALDQTVNDCISQARAFNTKGRETRDKRTALDASAKPLREAIALHVQEVKRAQVEKAKAEAAAKAEAEAAAKAKEVSEADKLRAENEALKAQLAAKG